MKIEARYICMDTKNRPNFSVLIMTGWWFWRKTINKIAVWSDTGWRWYSGLPVVEDDIRIALSEALIKMQYLYE